MTSCTSRPLAGSRGDGQRMPQRRDDPQRDRGRDEDPQRDRAAGDQPHNRGEQSDDADRCRDDGSRPGPPRLSLCVAAARPR